MKPKSNSRAKSSPADAGAANKPSGMAGRRKVAATGGILAGLTTVIFATAKLVEAAHPGPDHQPIEYQRPHAVEQPAEMSTDSNAKDHGRKTGHDTGDQYNITVGHNEDGGVVVNNGTVNNNHK
jgi:hypothetical protein